MRRLVRLARVVVPALLVLTCADGGTRPVLVSSVDVIAPAASVPVYRTLQLGATLLDTKGNTLLGRTVTWSSSSDAVATVSADGLVSGISAGGVTITATSEGRNGSVSLTVLPAAVDTVSLSPETATLAQGATRALTVTLKDERGATLDDRTVDWTTSDAAVATVSSDGLVTGLAGGTATITATAEGKAGAALVTVTSGSGPSISILSVSPATLVPGASATISGSGFHAAPADNGVTIGGVAAVVTAATTMQLQVTVPCVPSGTVPVVVSVAGDTTPAYAHPLQVTGRHTLAIGQSAVITDGTRVGCNEITAAGVESRYVLAVYNTTASPAAMADYQLSGTMDGLGAGAAGVGSSPAPRVAERRLDLTRPAGLSQLEGSVEPHEDASHYQLLEKNQAAYRQLWQQYGGGARRSAGAFLSAASAPPLTRTIRVSNLNAANICTSYFTINATRVYYSGRLAIYEDDATPAALKAASNATMAAYYQQIGDQFNADMDPIVRANFGDVLRRDAVTDNDGVLIAVFTPVINNELPKLAGFVVSCDQFPNGVNNTASNHGEYFYAYQPTTGAGSNSVTPDAWYRGIRSIFIHETKHVASFAARVANDSPMWEESWLEEGTARHAEELWARQAVYNVAWKGNTGYGSASDPNSIYCDVRWTNAACNASNPRRPALAMWRHFAPLYGFLGNSSSLSPFGRSASDDAFYFYATSWSLVRYAIDRHATTEASFLSSLNQATTSGTTNLSARAGVNIAELLGGWALALYADDLAGLGSSAELQMPTWNFPHIYAGLKADYPSTYTRAQPLVTTPLTFGTIGPTNYTALVGGGVDYFELSGVHTAAQVLSIQSPGGGDPSSALRLAILRVQ